MYIRKASSDDVKKISYLICKNTEKVTENNYTITQIEVWKKRNTPAQIKKSLVHRDIFCAFEKERLVGTIALEQKEVVGLYVSPSKRKKGVGKSLLQYLEGYAKQKNLHELFLTSTPSAEAFYQRNGYKAIDYVELDISGMIFKELKMRKKLLG